MSIKISDQVNDKNYEAVERRAQQYPAIATSGSSYLVVWECQNKYNIYGQMLDRSGSKKIGGNFIISKKGNTDEPYCLGPAIAYNRSYGTKQPNKIEEFLVVYSEDFTVPIHLMSGQFVDASGTLGKGLTISDSPNFKSASAVASDGDDFLVVWREQLSGSGPSLFDIRGRYVTQSGAVIGNTDLKICTDADKVYRVSTAYGNKCYLVVWDESRCIYGQIVNKSGDLVGQKLLISGDREHLRIFPSVASNGLNFLVVWEDHRESSMAKSAIYGQFVDMTGNLVGNNFVICNESTSSHPSVWHGSDPDLKYFVFHVVWSDSRKGNPDIYYQYVGTDGKLPQVVNNCIEDNPAAQSFPAVSGGVVAWQDFRGGDWDIYGYAFPGCFIATAAYGSPFAPEVQFLRNIRDNSFRKSNWGNKVIDLFEAVYYTFSPQIAQTMLKHRELKRAIRWVIVAPIVRLLSFVVLLIRARPLKSQLRSPKK